AGIREGCLIYTWAKTKVIVRNKRCQIVKEAFVQNGAVFSGRPLMPLVRWLNRESHGILMATYGHSWRQGCSARFALHTAAGTSAVGSEETVEERVCAGGGASVTGMLQTMKFLFPLQIYQLGPISCGQTIPGPHQKIRQNVESLMEFFVGIVEEHKKTLDPDSPRDYIDAYLVEMAKVRDEVSGTWDQLIRSQSFIQSLVHTDMIFSPFEQQGSNEDSTFNVDNMVRSAADLFGAGTETTANTLRWALVYMLEHPDVQGVVCVYCPVTSSQLLLSPLHSFLCCLGDHTSERCHEEIVRVLGFDRAPCMDDRAQLPYTCATIHEVQRCANIVPLGVVHQTTQPTKLRGYHLPTGTDVMPNLTAILADKEHWKYPDTFNPENFLDERGQFCKNDAFHASSLLGEVPRVPGRRSLSTWAKNRVIVLNNLSDCEGKRFVQNGAVAFFLARPSVPVNSLGQTEENYGIVMATYGHTWRQQRRFALHTLRDFGLGRKTVEERVAEEAHYLVKEMLKQEGFDLRALLVNPHPHLSSEQITGKPFYPIHPFMNAVSNIICSIIFGDRFEYDNQHFANLLDILSKNIRLSSYVGQCVCVCFLLSWQGTFVMANLTAIMTDKEHWKYPDTFSPENFLDEKGQFCKNDAFLPFSLGPRVCLGEALARTELFIFFTSLLQRLKFSWPPGAPPYNMEGIVGVIRSPVPFNTICRSRETTH
ncbi:hypothetical protein NFI96_031717, partial [Prochilodus magdalenae]